ncbi:aminoglycoside phosphotransferase (APT) family kinase protein [Nocardia transvalensis]|uniref:Aminoglycoside phosphotransferase (APT) family kinase protein n=1 Tax=Nocardia transvalensis TaxID=37333 RepID=A0A7W9PBE6_9NOCA|nr:phosphotransferase [Nocardia transvalensis]MBB5912578.1 aminoglycoside phosphotransferase (APT) family kinase protein [Nocardia transvalensis]
MPLDGDWFAVLTRVAREAGAEGVPEVLSDRADGPVVRLGEVVAKAHATDTDIPALRTRVAIAADPRLRTVLLPPIPIGDDLLRLSSDRPITLWRYGIPVDPDTPEAAPWEEAAALLAELHSISTHNLGRALPKAGGPERVRHAIARLRSSPHADSPAAEVILRAYDALPDLEPSPDSPTPPSFFRHAFGRNPPEPAMDPGQKHAGKRKMPESDQAGKTLAHGDFHLGQLVRVPNSGGAGENPWRLIDVDDLGWGDPVWDLARPAGFFAAGVLDPVAWQRFLGAYRACGGPAVPGDGAEWGVLDGPARALVVQAAARAVAKGRVLDDLDVALIDACSRMTALTYGG